MVIPAVKIHPIQSNAARFNKGRRARFSALYTRRINQSQRPSSSHHSITYHALELIQQRHYLGILKIKWKCLQILLPATKIFLKAPLSSPSSKLTRLSTRSFEGDEGNRSCRLSGTQTSYHAPSAYTLPSISPNLRRSAPGLKWFSGNATLSYPLPFKLLVLTTTPLERHRLYLGR